MRVFDFFGSGRHFVPRTAIDDIDIFRAQPQGGTGRVHRHIAAADYCDIAADLNRCGSFGEFIGLHQIDPGQKLIGRVHAIEVFARHLHEVRQSGAGADKHGIIAFFLHQFVNRECFADHCINDHFHAQILESFDFAFYDILRQTELGDPIHQNTASRMQRFEQRNLVPHAGQIAGHSQTGRTTANDSHFADLHFGRRRRQRTGTA